MFAIGSVDHKQMLCIVAQRCMDQMIQLLQNDKDLTQHHLGTISKTALYDVDRLEVRELPRRHDARDYTQQQYESDADTDGTQTDVAIEIYLALKQFYGIVLEGKGQSQADDKRATVRLI